MDSTQIIGKSTSINDLLSFIENASESNSNVFILGETGVGKEIAAKAIHDKGHRKNNPFVKINCATLNDNLLESELFGHRKGAFTGALFDRPGLIESANSGTFFFDEIGDISLNLQAKLLAVIEDKEIRRIGENVYRKIDIRFIFATNKDIHKLVIKGKFREDLYYRINILSFLISPLRDRKEDIPLLTSAFLKKKYQRMSKAFSLTANALNKLCSYSFPGNVRELENILERACELSRGTVIKEEDIIINGTVKFANGRNEKVKLRVNRIIDALVENRGNKTKTAKQLGISRVHLYRLLNMANNNRT